MTDEGRDTKPPRSALNTRWQHRRRMAYIALYSCLAVTYLALFKISETRLSAASEVLTWFYITMGSIIGAYVGFRTLDDKWQKKDRDE